MKNLEYSVGIDILNDRFFDRLNSDLCKYYIKSKIYILYLTEEDYNITRSLIETEED